MTKHYNIHIKGRVQGVGFRYSAKSVAHTFQIYGFVKNIYDGSVYIEAEGLPDNLSHFIHWCHHGPDRAKVSHVSVIEGEVAGFLEFDTRS
jgi:acylphosphatase